MPLPVDVDRLPGDWWVVDGTGDGAALERELASELPQGHALVGVKARAVAVRRHLKDVIFWLPDTSEWALVHLTYRVEADPGWPSTFVADS